MFRSVREHGPVLLVPLAWTFAAAADAGALAERTVLIAHVVMCVLLFAFAALSYAEMREGVLRAWWNVVAAGFVLTLFGTAVLFTGGDTALLRGVVLGWMVLPIAGFLPTARRTAPRVYYGAALLSALGALVYATLAETGTVLGFALVGAGQTAAIGHAVVRY